MNCRFAQYDLIKGIMGHQYIARIIVVHEMHSLHHGMHHSNYSPSHYIIYYYHNNIGETQSCNLKHSLVHALQGQISSQWYSFGLAIGVPKQILNQLKHYSDEECLVEVLDYWLKHHPGKPTWQEVVEAKNRIMSAQ